MAKAKKIWPTPLTRNRFHQCFQCLVVPVGGVRQPNKASISRASNRVQPRIRRGVS